MCVSVVFGCVFFFFKQKTAYEMRISDWSSDVCSSDLLATRGRDRRDAGPARDAHAAVSRPIRGTGANRLTVALRDRQALALGRRAIVEQRLARRGGQHDEGAATVVGIGGAVQQPRLGHPADPA